MTVSRPCIAMLTDFGQADSYVGIMKGVIAGISPDATIVDLTHAVPPQDVREGAWQLLTAYRYFPQGTIFLCVVDPGVGTRRRALVMTAGCYHFVGPDNGLLSWAVNHAGGEGGIQAHALENPEFWLQDVSATFHGRDVFAPAAGHLAAGRKPDAFGPAVEDWERLEFPEPDTTRAGMLVGKVLHIDRFGNLITNISQAAIENLQAQNPSKRAGVRWHAAHVDHISATYADASAGSLVALVGSTGHLELALNGGDAAARFRGHLGEPVTVMLE